MSNPRPIGLFDSGVGGLSVLREIRRQLPRERVLYLADQAHLPYGPRPLAEVRAFAEGIVRFLLAQEAKLIVVACNTASAASLHYLRQRFGQTPFVGMEPAVKPAASKTRTGVVGVIATEATFQGELFAGVVARFARGAQVVTQTCPAFVTQVEAGELNSPRTRRLAETYLRPLLEAHIDQLVLGCTHFPFLKPLLAEIVGPKVEIVDPAPAVARQTARLLRAGALLNDGPEPGRAAYYSSGSPQALATAVNRLLGEQAKVIPVRWRGGALEECAAGS